MVALCNKEGQYNSYNEFPVYQGNDLGTKYSPESTQFRIWSPEAEEAKLHIYDDGLCGEAYESYDMNASKDGTWELSVDKNLKNVFYDFQIKYKGEWLTPSSDPYAKAVGINGERGAVIDFKETNPKDWDLDQRPALENFNAISLYEVHMRDFSVSPNSGMQHKGKFLAFTEEGTTNEYGQKTGIDHLKELGISHVHILPSFDFSSIDESKLEENNYNWGYDPENFNVPEGSYSTNPYNPITRILEFKQMVQSLHKNGMRVILDVVYNHTHIAERSDFNLITPGYYYRQNDDGSLSNASGCGNETASERAMVRKFIIESVKYWATEYHIDGFRFDLMGIHDVDTMNAIRTALDKIDPSLFIYGEGWTAGDSPLPFEHRAVKQHANQMPGIAVFSDDIRDALRGNWANAQAPGFAGGSEGYDESIKFSITGAVPHDQIHYGLVQYAKSPYANEPSQTINYASCHDDLCLVDKLIYSAPEGTNQKDLKRFNRLAQTVVFTSQGVPFIYAGEELKRNKKGIHNSYQSPDSINQIDWNFKHENESLYNYYKGLVKLRKEHPAFRMTSAEMIKKKLRFLPQHQSRVVAYTLNDNANGDSWKQILVIFNGNRHQIGIDIPVGNWSVISNSEFINLNGIFNWNKSYINVPASSAMILRRL